MRLPAVFLASLLLSATCLPIVVRAENQSPVTTRIVTPSNAPTMLQSTQAEWLCIAGRGWITPPLNLGPSCGDARWESRMRFLIGITNPSSHKLLSFDVQYTVFDADNAKIGQAMQSITLNEPLSLGEKQVVQSPNESLVAWKVGTGFDLSEPPSAVSYVTLKIVKASFTGNRMWVAGQPLPG